MINFGQNRNQTSTTFNSILQRPITRKRKYKRSAAENSSAPSLSGVLNDWKQEVAGRALRVAAKAGGASLKMGKALLLKPEQRNIFRKAGLSLKDLGNLAGMTQNEISDALKIWDTSLLKAVEDGTATLSFELILRLAALYSRYDPIPFIIKYTRTYSPAIWKRLDKFLRSVANHNQLRVPTLKKLHVVI